jgi:hypothetical protein
LVNVVEFTDSNAPSTNLTTKTITGEFVNILPNHTRTWEYNSTAQIGQGSGGPYVDMSNYSVSSTGASAQAEGESSQGGVELQFAHIIKRYKRFEWGVGFAAGLSDINTKTQQNIRARITKTTDRYGIRSTDSNGQTLTAASFPDAWYVNKSQRSTVDVPIGPFAPAAYSYSSEQAKYMSTTPLSTGIVSYEDADVTGYWQIKGAYYMLRLGPTARFELNNKWTISLNAGVAMAYAGTRFIADEYVLIDGTVGPYRIQEESEETRFVPGYYGDINIERWISVRTGFYIGYGYEKLGDYSQKLGERSADIDLGTSSGFRFGIITRF